MCGSEHVEHTHSVTARDFLLDVKVERGREHVRYT